MLGKERQNKLKELMLVPELQPAAVAQAAAIGQHPSNDPDLGKATVSDLAQAEHTGGPEASYAQQVQALQEIQFQKLRDEGLRAQREATDRFRADPDQAIDILQEYLDSLREAELAPDRVALLQRPVEARLQQLRALRQQQAYERQQAGRQETFSQIKTREARLEEHKQQEVAELMKQYHDFYKEGKYKEAEMAAMRAHELDPDNASASAAVHVAHIQRAQAEYADLKNHREDMVLKGLDDAEDEGPVLTAKNPIDYDAQRWEIAKNRKVFPVKGVAIDIKTEREREIEQKLSLPITVDFKDVPLKNVIEDLRDMTGINIVPDQPALDEENISLDRPVTMHLDNLAAKSAINILLHQAHLIYVIKDEVLQITTEAHARGKMVQTTYQVADLIIPVDDHTLPNTFNIEKNIEQSTNGQTFNLGGTTPYTSPRSLLTGTPVGGNVDQNKNSATITTTPSHTPGKTIEDVLIKMITSTIKPETWSEMGGQGTIEYYPLGMALVVSQTPDIQEQIAELLQALRRLQDLEMAVEVRFITVSESFYERMGLDFNINILADNTKYEPQLVSQQFQPFGFNNDFSPKSFVTGIQTPGSGFSANQFTFTPDLNIPLKQDNFNRAIPPFGGFQNTPPDGGLTLGLAFLSDIQVFLFLEAAQGDQRANVMQAPKLTLFNGQTSAITITTTRFFVTNVTVGAANGQLFYLPTNTSFAIGVTLVINGVISADRRFVRLNMAPTVSNLTTPTPDLFPITSFITPSLENGTSGTPIPFTQFIQLPTLDTITVNTTVNVPDGGTVVMGGLKTMQEGRNEFGPPFLSKIPYLNRLFKNVGYGRSTDSLMIMVTPRIIINEEEEIRQTGVGATPGGTPGVPVP
jgi:type II secretory pathway component GspD/PulD (secretin)